MDDLDQKFETKWTLWFHKVDDSDYSLASYKKLYEVKTIRDFCKMINTIPSFTSGMFFFMKGDIEPLWENKDNITGGMWKFKLTKKSADKIWNTTMASLCGNSLTNDAEYMKCITGISISPKITNCIIKIWNNDNTITDASFYLKQQEGLDLEGVRYQRNRKTKKNRK